MASYLERYRQGECEQMWAELVALGERVRSEPLYTDALAVARETMRRVSHNIELLIPRLETIGYKFGYGPTDPDEAAWVPPGPPPYTPPNLDVKERIAELERQAGVLSLSIRAFYELVGSVNFVGNPPEDWGDLGQEQWISEPMANYRKEHPVYDEAAFDQLLSEHLVEVDPDDQDSYPEDYGLDPLYVGPIAILSQVHESHSEVDKSFATSIAPDHLTKFRHSGSGAYEIVIPNGAADAPLEWEWHHTTFVNYLRICFRWGGFPGLERAAKPPMEDLAYLTEGLFSI
jgi:hypothetical protein